MIIAQNCVVQLEFEARLEGERVDHTHNPRLILIGRERDLPPGLEALLIGRDAPQTFTATVPDAFGSRDESRVVTVNRAELPAQPLEVGRRFTAQDADGNALEARVVAVDGERVTVDMNHPRAGKTLEYTVTIHAVRLADAHELEHGHAHGEGGVVHHHHD
jgi:FKBP-type peptidyl-prolyl cis-trans isomerase SlyD